SWEEVVTLGMGVAVWGLKVEEVLGAILTEKIEEDGLADAPREAIGDEAGGDGEEGSC
ncbi:hypothetical protein HDU82_003833, partial [Entophlyctis luteolus]